MQEECRQIERSRLRPVIRRILVEKCQQVKRKIQVIYRQQVKRRRKPTEGRWQVHVDWQRTCDIKRQDFV